MDELMKQAEDHLAKGRVQIATDEAVHNIKHIAADQSGVDERAKFEEFASKPPFELNIRRYPENGNSSWPGQYRDNDVQRMWESWQAALSSNAAQSAGQEPVGYMVYWGALSQKPYMPFNTKKEAEEAASCIKYATEIKPLYTRPSSAAQVEEIRNAAQALIDVALEGAEDNVHVCDRNNDEAKLATLYPEVKALYRALKTAAPSKGEE